MATDSPAADALLDAIALIRARLTGDDEATVVILRHCQPRLAASIPAGLHAELLSREADPVAALDPVAVTSRSAALG